ncbi:MAG: paaX [Acidimicrobiales bacterium]|nr:paaX [Acidimicrobiales bacterium]
MSSRRNSRSGANPEVADVDVELPRLTARSVVASTLLGVSPPELPTPVLVGTAELLGINPGAARVAMSRMVANGELAATERGYRLVGRLVTRQARQDLSRTGPSTAWKGQWRTLIVEGEGRPAAERAELRAALGSLRFAELREGVWLRPDNLPEGVLVDAETAVAGRTLRLTSRVDDPSSLAARLWDLDSWARRGADLVDRLDGLDRLDLDLAGTFVTLAAVLRHLQADPLLPPALLAADWPGDRLRARHAEVDAAFKHALATWQRARR